MNSKMLGDMTLMQTIKLFMPLIIVQLGLVVFCLYRLTKDRVKYLPKWAWVLIILLSNLLGSILYLLIGRERD